MGLTFIAYNLKEYKYILASLSRHQSQPTPVGGRQAQDILPSANKTAGAQPATQQWHY